MERKALFRSSGLFRDLVASRKSASQERRRDINSIYSPFASSADFPPRRVRVLKCFPLFAFDLPTTNSESDTFKVPPGAEARARRPLIDWRCAPLPVRRAREGDDDKDRERSLDFIVEVVYFQYFWTLDEFICSCVIIALDGIVSKVSVCQNDSSLGFVQRLPIPILRYSPEP